MRKVALVLLLLTLALTAQRRKRDAAEGFFHTDVPPHLYNLTLGRADASSVTATVLAHQPLEGYFAVGSRRTAAQPFAPGEPVSVLLDRLTADTRYTYRFRYRTASQSGFQSSPEYAFHTRRAAGRAFTFAVQADSHLDENSSPDVYRQTLAGIQAAQPDFLLDLGDTFMTDRRRDDFRQALPQYLAQRYYFGLVSPSVPLFLVLGNHDGEDASRAEMAQWSLAQRTRLFPNPRTASERENYYAFPWGDALFVVLDPYWSTTSRQRGDLWRWTLGAAQYQWLQRTLAQDRSVFKFVFIHHPIGANSEPTRGGVAAARYGEWGGLDADDRPAFATRRAGWAEPIQQLLVKHGVQVVFHGHDHFYAREELDGVIYQLVPQPGNPRAAAVPRNAAEYGYRDGVILGGSGYVRVSVSPRAARVDYVATTQEVRHSYSISAR